MKLLDNYGRAMTSTSFLTSVSIASSETWIRLRTWCVVLYTGVGVRTRYTWAKPPGHVEMSFESHRHVYNGHLPCDRYRSTCTVWLLTEMVWPGVRVPLFCAYAWNACWFAIEFVRRMNDSRVATLRRWNACATSSWSRSGNHSRDSDTQCPSAWSYTNSSKNIINLSWS